MMDINDFRGIATLLALAAFLGIWAWAWSKGREHGFDNAANQPFDFEEEQLHQQSLKEIEK